MYFCGMILIAPDKFKGTLDAERVASGVADALRECGVSDEIMCRPLADGGEGSQRVLLSEPRSVCPGVYVDGEEVVVVSADVVGRGCFDRGIGLMERSSRQLGIAMQYAMSLKPRRLTVAVGGTMCSDGGAGMLAALGGRFYDKAGNDISAGMCAERLRDIYSIDFCGLESMPTLEAMIDVEAELCTGELSAIDFAPQKALPGEDISGLREGLQRLSAMITGRSRYDGAGGGIGFGLCSVLGAKGYLGAERAAASLPWERKPSIVITGEGKVDSQTVLGGKLVDRVVKAAERSGAQAYIVCGTMEEGVPYSNVYRSDIYEGSVEERLAAAVREIVRCASWLREK